VKDALVFVKSAKGGKREVCVLFDLRGKDAKKWKIASFFAMRGLREAAGVRKVEIGNWSEGRGRGERARCDEGARCGRWRNGCLRGAWVAPMRRGKLKLC
jgi:hypothetical protein